MPESAPTALSITSVMSCTANTALITGPLLPAPRPLRASLPLLLSLNITRETNHACVASIRFLNFTHFAPGKRTSPEGIGSTC